MDIGDVRKNTKLIIDGIPYNVDDAEFMKPGKGRAIYRLKLRNLLDSSTLDRTFHSGDKIQEAQITTNEMQYLYKENDSYIFMNTETFEQLTLTEKQVDEKRSFLKEGMLVTITMMLDQPVDISLPIFVELKVVQSEMTSKKFTVDAQTKSALLETGYSIEVPTFIKEGDIIKIDTRTGTYVERAGTKR